mmetsp:Transcript_101251/g.287085  ORF Transcript_101251/g.287085 Transcript_101251/m.287085 type:complete len:218 (+) Transcript_101251:114-767(+)
MLNCATLSPRTRPIDPSPSAQSSSDNVPSGSAATCSRSGLCLAAASIFTKSSTTTRLRSGVGWLQIGHSQRFFRRLNLRRSCIALNSRYASLSKTPMCWQFFPRTGVSILMHSMGSMMETMFRPMEISTSAGTSGSGLAAAAPSSLDWSCDSFAFGIPSMSSTLLLQGFRIPLLASAASSCVANIPRNCCFLLMASHLPVPFWAYTPTYLEEHALAL